MNPKMFGFHSLPPPPWAALFGRSGLSGTISRVKTNFCMFLCCFSVFSCLGNPFRDGFADINLLLNGFVLFVIVFVFGEPFSERVCR